MEWQRCATQNSAHLASTPFWISYADAGVEGRIVRYNLGGGNAGETAIKIFIGSLMLPPECRLVVSVSPFYSYHKIVISEGEG